jgi:hypothetical protein
MQDKHKVTLYLPPDLHRQLKIRSAVELEPMSAIAERALEFYLMHSDMVDGVEASHGQVHRVYNCPECASSLVLRDDEIVSIREQVDVVDDLEGTAAIVRERQHINLGQQGEEELVPC